MIIRVGEGGGRRGEEVGKEGGEAAVVAGRGGEGGGGGESVMIQEKTEEEMREDPLNDEACELRTRKGKGVCLDNETRSITDIIEQWF